MLTDKQKIAVGAGALGLGSLIVWALTKKPPEEPPPGEAGADVGIEIYDKDGNLIPSNSPVELVEGSSYTARVTVTNQSTKLGQPVAASLRVVVVSVVSNLPSVPDTFLIPQQEKSQSFAASQSLYTDFPLSVPVGIAGANGFISAKVFSPDGVQIAAAMESVSIRAIAITGAIGPGLIYYVGIPSGGWENIVSGRQIPIGKGITVSPNWVNYSSVSIAGRVTLSVIYPNGQKVDLTAVVNQDKTATPGNGYSVQFTEFQSSQEGTYTLTAQLTSQGQVLDTEIFTLVAIAEIVYGATVVIGV